MSKRFAVLIIALVIAQILVVQLWQQMPSHKHPHHGPLGVLRHEVNDLLGISGHHQHAAVSPQVPGSVPAPELGAAVSVNESASPVASANSGPMLSLEQQLPAELMGGRPETSGLSRWLPHQHVVGDIRHPFAYWRVWAEHPVNLVYLFVFSVITSLIAWAVIPDRLERAKVCCRQQFWKSLLTGIMATAMVLMLCRILFITGIGSPLGFLLIGCLQLGHLIGLTVAASVLGNGLGRRLNLVLTNMEQSSKSLIMLLLGLLLIGFILLVPGFGGLPRIGIRLVALVAVFGLGGFLRTRLGIKEIAS